MRAKETRPMPSKVEVEKALLGCLLTEPRLLDEIAPKLDPESGFYNLVHRIIYKALIAMDALNRKIDLITIANYLEEQKQLEEVGGASYLAELSASIPTTANLETYLEIVIEYSQKRQLIHEAIRLYEACYNETKKTDEILNQLEENLNKIFKLGIINEPQSLKEYSPEFLKSKAEQLEQGMTLGYDTGYFKLTELGLFKPSRLVLLGAVTSTGKTAFALNLSLNIAMNHPQETVLFFSLEMTKEDITDRIINTRKILLENQGQNELEELERALQEKPTNLKLDDTPRLKPIDIKRKAKIEQKKGSLSLIVVDYLHIVDPNTPGATYERELDSISKELRAISKELKAPIFLTAQVNTQGKEARANNKELEIHHLQASRAVAQNVDSFLLLNYYQTKDDNKAKLMIKNKKSRNEKANKELWFDYDLDTQTIIQASPITDEERQVTEEELGGV